MTTTIPQAFTVAFALAADAAELIDNTEPGQATLPGHKYGPFDIRTRRTYTPERDTLTLIAYHDGQMMASIVAVNNGAKTVARIHQMRIGDLVIKRTTDHSFTGIGRVDGQRRRFTLTVHRGQGWTVDVNGEEPTRWLNFTEAANHITDTYHPAS